MITSPGAGPRIVVLGASGLIGHFLAADLAGRGYRVSAVARALTAAQRFALSASTVVERPVVALETDELASLLREQGASLVVNCVGILQDAAGASTREVHEAFVGRLIAAIGAQGRPVLLVHIGIPGHEDDDRTPFSLTKRRAERMIMDAALPAVILRPGLVVAPAAYGSSALIRALAALPLDLPAEVRDRPCAAVAAEDVAATIAFLAEHWSPQQPALKLSLDLVHPEPMTAGQLIALFRAWLGTAGRRRLPLPGALLSLGARAGDLASRLGWLAPIRSTALAELRRGITGDPGPWIAATGIAPRPIARVLAERPATVQETWFARLYLLKPLVIATLAVFWCASGLIALTAAYGAAVEVLTSRGFPVGLSHTITIASSVIDIAVGMAIAVRRSCRIGLLAGIGVALFYMVTAAILTPDLWREPLGALVKTGPAIALMLVALAILERR